MLHRKIRKDDKVMIIAGKDKGKIGKVLKILPKKNALLVEKVNMVKRHNKGNPYAGQPGGIVDKEAPINISNVAYMCDECAKPSRIGFRYDPEGKKYRYCKKCDQKIVDEKPKKS